MATFIQTHDGMVNLAHVVSIKLNAPGTRYVVTLTNGAVETVETEEIDDALRQVLLALPGTVVVSTDIRRADGVDDTTGLGWRLVGSEHTVVAWLVDRYGGMVPTGPTIDREMQDVAAPGAASRRQPCWLPAHWYSV